MEKQREAAFRLANTAGIGTRTIQKILAQTGSAAELFALPASAIAKLHGLRAGDAERILAGKKRNLTAELEHMEREGIRFVSMEDESYPGRLRVLTDAPYGLYYKYRLPPEDKKSVAIVGARRCSEYGYTVAKELGARLAACGIVVISGMAEGIDSAGQWGAVFADGETYAVLGCGPDICYPNTARNLYAELETCGGILSEYPPGSRPHPGYFPQRNRLISGLSDVVAVIEAREKSGSLITADYALEQGKDIYAVPGRVTDSLSGGCNRLIAQGAGIIVDVENFLSELSIQMPNNRDFSENGKQNNQNFLKFSLEKRERMVYSCLDLQPKSMEKLIAQTNLPVSELADSLTELLRRGAAKEVFKNQYIRQVRELWQKTL